jgi:hypothetical protein
MEALNSRLDKAKETAKGFASGAKQSIAAALGKSK